ncbi:LpxL/LpxP family acyltransferase [Achromobacter xylosoxidans]|uniref:LpxL/LpxP family acyltransferase n=1 Tax=Alcaligenes xylosoxydans xylosoxydans TaxID=85698 RepID=UPI0006C3FAC7|nr:glycosyl transferase [Achromobacter xylosoxidans]KWU15891.1 glycosyl transferase [Achromobacter xylosoxidans]MCH4573909.1 glycosyl transferase [Achromobacter xylosoxidans]MDD7991828.1 glycosyl transferase [Achromobacter xylosoxidans]OFL40202.1 glycosyl transferase [Achromobacter xylosoxidans]OFO64380.1 glycosyl transferase [Achromobacter xylosoxidans]
MTAADPHWAGQRERGNPALLRLTAWAARRIGRRAVAPVIWLVVLYFYVFGPRARRAIGAYQRRLARGGALAAPLPTPFPVYRQYLAFAQALLDKLDVWQGRITLADLDIDDPDGLQAQMGVGRGQILVGSHLGNIEVCRALAEQSGRLHLNVLVHTRHAVNFGRLLEEAGGGLRMIQVSELDAGVMLDLAQRLERGEWLAIAGDRVPLKGDRSAQVELLGDAALLPQGPWLLAGLLRCPVNLLFCTRHGARHRMSMERLADAVEWTRATRQAEIARWAQRYADRLGAQCRQAPLQWFNFYPFWKDDA